MKLPAKWRPLEPYLSGSPRDNGEWDMHCPLHPDTKRSASVNLKTGLFFCFARCGGCNVNELLARRGDWVPAPGGSTVVAEPDDAEPLPSMGEVKSWSDLLLEEEEAHLDHFITKRGLFTQTVADRLIGWHPNKRVFTIPVFDATGDLITVRHYNMGAEGGRKFWSLKGRGSAFLYPIDVLRRKFDQIIICEGELDALILNQAGFRAVTRTGAAKVWQSSWNRYFKDKVVYLCHDCDKAGQEANVKVGTSLRTIAQEVRVIMLPYPITEDHGKDVTDFWTDRGGTTNKKAKEAWQKLMEDAQLFDPDTLRPRELDPEDAQAIDALNAEHYARPLRIIGTVYGKARSTYTIPKTVDFTCTRDAGPLCKRCPMFEDGGRMTLEIQRKDPVVLKMIDSPSDQVDKLVLMTAGIPTKCPQVEMDRTFQSIEILHMRPSVEHQNGSRGDMTSLRVTNVGRHDTPSNTTIEVIGALHANPRNQTAEFLSWHAAELRTLDSSFQMTPKSFRLMSVFQPDEGQTSLAKLKEIAKDLSNHVTRIYGRDLLHIAMDLVWHSVLQFKFRGQMLQRGWLELLVVGDTRTGKSEIGTRLMQHYQAGEMINCEAASFAGVIGGTQQIRNEWTLTWGVVPVNDRRLVLLDEISGLSVEEIGQMSSVRSSGVAAIEKVVQDKTPARTRMIWMGNPRDDISMSTYTYGIYAIKPLIGRREDIARFDMAMTLRTDDVSVDRVMRRESRKPPVYSAEACSTLVRWVWTRQPSDVVWERGAEDLVMEMAREMGDIYVDEPPLVLRADVRIKLARLAVAIAARLFSTEDGQRLIVRRRHVRAARAFLDAIYSIPTFGYRDISVIRHKDSLIAKENAVEAAKFLDTRPEIWNFLRTLPEGRFYARDLEEVLNITRDAANAIVNKLVSSRLAQKDKGAIRVLPELLELVKEHS